MHQLMSHAWYPPTLSCHLLGYSYNTQVFRLALSLHTFICSLYCYYGVELLHRRLDGTRTSVSCLHYSALALPYDVSCPDLCHFVAASKTTKSSHYSSSSM